MLECCDLERAIDSGQFTTLVEVLVAVRARALAISETLARQGRVARDQTPAIDICPPSNQAPSNALAIKMDWIEQ
jgi:hypothetical protein